MNKQSICLTCTNRMIKVYKRKSYEKRDEQTDKQMYRQTDIQLH